MFIDFSFELEGAIAREMFLLAKSIVPGWINVMLTLITRYSSLHLQTQTLERLKQEHHCEFWSTWTT